MWTIMGLALFAVGVYLLFRPNTAAKAREADLWRAIDNIKAKQPEIIRDLMKEEYPEFSKDITFNRVSQMLDAHANFWSSSEGQKYITQKNGLFVRSSEFKSSDDEKIYKELVAEKSASAISEEFKTYALNDPEVFYEKLHSLISSASSIMQSDPATRISRH